MKNEKYIIALGYSILSISLTLLILLKYLGLKSLVEYLLDRRLVQLIEISLIILSTISLVPISAGWLLIGRKLKISEASICGESGLITFSALFLLEAIVYFSHVSNPLIVICEKLGGNILSLLMLFSLFISLVFVISHVISHFTVSRIVNSRLLRIAGYLQLTLLSYSMSCLLCYVIDVLEPQSMFYILLVLVILLLSACFTSSLAILKVQHV